MVRQKNARPCHDSAAFTSHFPAIEIADARERVVEHARAGTDGAGSGELGESLARHTFDRIPLAIQHGSVVHELHAKQALQLLHAAHQRVDRTARDTCCPLVDANEHELVVSQALDPLSEGTPCAAH